MLRIKYENTFRKDYKRIIKRGYDSSKLFDVIESLTSEMPLQAKNKDHNLTGNYSEFRECHILPDWLLIYRINESNKTLELVRTGSHSDLF